MGRVATGALAVALAAGAAAVGRALSVRGKGRWPAAERDARRSSRWQVVTVARPPGEVLPGGRWSEPLARLGDGIEVHLREAPGGRGTELAGRPSGGSAGFTGMAAHLVGDDPAMVVREALRAVKQLAETGEVLRGDRPSFDRRAVPG